ncbi:hypothetical protein DP091_14015 [Paenibacillus sp. MDMC362]|nr:hypothetical protein DP091_14015 [Paenibacillus sp. MDMC362]
MEVKRTEDPLFRENRPIMDVTRTHDPLLHRIHGLITKNLAIADLLSTYCCEMGKNKEIAEPVSSKIAIGWILTIPDGGILVRATLRMLTMPGGGI